MLCESEVAMVRVAAIVALTGLLGLASLLVPPTAASGQISRAALAARCLHDSGETPADRTRREQALSLAREINDAQERAFSQARRYRTLQQLGNLPEIPQGFVVKLQTDGAGYIFSIKDDRDACRYGIFSDQQGTVYESSPTVPHIASQERSIE
jgi:hypothetical protein